MPAKTPEEICTLFRQFMREGNMEGLLSIYDDEAVFVTAEGAVKRGKEELRQELAPMANAKAKFEFKIKQIAQTGDIALMHTLWDVSSPKPMSVYAIEIARQQTDGTWRWLIGDPFTVGRPVPQPG